MASKLADDPRIDPRIKKIFGRWNVRAGGNVASREDLIAIENSATGKAAAAAMHAFLESCDNETIAPSAGLTIRTISVVSSPDGNKINIQFIRPDRLRQRIASWMDCLQERSEFELLGDFVTGQ